MKNDPPKTAAQINTPQTGQVDLPPAVTAAGLVSDRTAFKGSGAKRKKPKPGHPWAHPKTPRRDDPDQATKHAEIARTAILADAGGLRGIKRDIQCPNCQGGKLSFVVAGFTGQIKASCSTPNCTKIEE